MILICGHDLEIAGRLELGLDVARAEVWWLPEFFRAVGAIAAVRCRVPVGVEDVRVVTRDLYVVRVTVAELDGSAALQAELGGGVVGHRLRVVDAAVAEQSRRVVQQEPWRAGIRARVRGVLRKESAELRGRKDASLVGDFDVFVTARVRTRLVER